MAQAKLILSCALGLGTWCLSAAAEPAASKSKPAPAAVKAPPAPAATPAPVLALGGADSPAKERAHVLFDQGVAAYREARFFDAVEIFSETYRLYPEPELLFNVGKAYEGMNNQGGALRYYREYLRRSPSAADRVEVASRIERLEQALSSKGIQQLTILSTPDGATLSLDGQPVGVTPWTGQTFAGKHRLALSLAGYQNAEQVIELDLSRAEDFSVSLEAEPPKQLLATPARLPPSEPKIGALTLTTIGAGVALLGASAIAQAAGGTDASGFSRTAAFFAGGGAGLSLLGGMMLYFDLSPRHEDESPKPSVSWAAVARKF